MLWYVFQLLVMFAVGSFFIAIGEADNMVAVGVISAFCAWLFTGIIALAIDGWRKLRQRREQ